MYVCMDSYTKAYIAGFLSWGFHGISVNWSVLRREIHFHENLVTESRKYFPVSYKSLTTWTSVADKWIVSVER